MDISMRLEKVNGRKTMAVYVSGHRIRQGLSETEASALVAQLLNEDFAHARVWNT